MPKYEGQDHYLDPGTHVLRSKLGTGDEDELSRAETVMRVISRQIAEEMRSASRRDYV
jgi:fido (protein-threonine AMPylation protein)